MKLLAVLSPNLIEYTSLGFSTNVNIIINSKYHQMYPTNLEEDMSIDCSTEVSLSHFRWN